jgi:NAD(P)-dependent dehydrogenase (short-subunit alcohol dehydrogenase family)
MDWTGRVAVITGGASGIGLAIARKACLDLQMKIAICDINDKSLVRVKNEEKHFTSENSLIMKCDVTNAEQIKMFADAVYQKFNDVGILFSNAGIGGGSSAFETDMKTWRRVMDITWFSNVIVASEFVPRMKQQKAKSKIVITASVAGLMNTSEDPFVGTPYTVAKQAARVYAESLYEELKDTNISVHVLCPGIIDTPLILPMQQDAENSKRPLPPPPPPHTIMQPNILADKLFQSFDRFYIVISSDGSLYRVAAERNRLIGDAIEAGLSKPPFLGDKEVRRKISATIKKASASKL